MSQDTIFKPIECPSCHHRLIDGSTNIKTAVVIDNGHYSGIQLDYKQKCWKCGAIIGIRKIG